MKSDKMKFATKAIHAKLDPDPSTGAVITPIYQTSTFHQEKPGLNKGFEYSRSSNPTRKALEENLAALENGHYGFCFGSGLAAVDAVLKLMSSGDEVLVSEDLYGGSYRIFTKVFEQFGVKFKFISLTDAMNLEQHISPITKMVWIETPTNPLMKIVDIRAIAEITQAKNVLLAVDNTFATPYLQRPLDLGADIVMHSITKYLGGHSDLVMGALVCKDQALGERIKFIQKSSGGISGPQDCFLALRGIKTLHLRMQRHCENAEIIAKTLIDEELVDQVYWPGFKDHPNHHIAKQQMDGYGGMVSFTLKEDLESKAHNIMSQFKLFTLAESLGGVESLVCHPATMTHAALPKEKRIGAGVTDSLIRLSVGIEDARDLVDDIKQAFQ